jgi:hypothetical protein
VPQCLRQGGLDIEVVAADGPLIVTNAATDARVRTISSVTEMGIGAWASPEC